MAEEEEDQNPKTSDSSSDSESEPESESAESEYALDEYSDYASSDEEEDNSQEAVVKQFNDVLNLKSLRKIEEEEERNYVSHEDKYDFPPDIEQWREEDLGEYWANAPLEMTKPGWDPVFADNEDWEAMRNEKKEGGDPPIAPFYVPFFKPYPAIPEDHYDIRNAKDVVEELDRIEEFLTWVSFIFADGSSYEGTVWDDYAHGKGVYVAEQGLVKYEGEWSQNTMEGHGVVEVDIPDVEPIPGSELEAKMRAEGKLLALDFMSPEDRKWMVMDIEDTVAKADGWREIPFYENDEWIRQFGKKPEKGRYRYAGQWKHGKMHGCGVYEVNEQPIFGRFYFGELLEDSTGCPEEIATLHAGIAEVAAAKARMFVNKPDGMVREARGPYGDPQHPYLYEEEDVWMAPGFINQFYEVPDYWKGYVEDVDEERQMWLNSFIKAPLRLPMPAELEHWWSKDEDPEFVLINKEPVPDPDNPSKLIYTEDPLILHTPTGRIINYIDDEEHGVRLFWQPQLENGEVDPEKAEFLPLGFDEFYGRTDLAEKKEKLIIRILNAIEKFCLPLFEKWDKWLEEKKKASDENLKLIEAELEFIEAELSLKETLEDMEMELKMKQKEEEKKEKEEEKKRRSMGRKREQEGASDLAEQEDNNEEDDEAEDLPRSFGPAQPEQGNSKTDKDDNQPGNSPFATTTMSFTPSNVATLVLPKLQVSLLLWKRQRGPETTKLPNSCNGSCIDQAHMIHSVNFPYSLDKYAGLKVGQKNREFCHRQSRSSPLHSLARVLSGSASRPRNKQVRERSKSLKAVDVLCLQIPLQCLD
ncbi:hypothetical protein AMTRI_Chr11g150240 [Amborella trichopoda]